MGLAVFHNDKLVGELTAKETMCHLLVSNKVENCNITIPHPEGSNKNVDLYLYNTNTPKIKIDIINGTPFIKVNLKLDARILSISSDSSYDTDEKLTEISLSASQYIQSIITQYLYKTSRKLNSDIDGFGTHALSLFLTKSDFEDYQWLKNYKDSVFEVSTDVHVKSAYLLSGNNS